MADLPAVPTTPAAAGPHRSVARRVVRLVVEGVVLVLAFQILSIGTAWATERTAIPPSCAEPSTIDYSAVGRPDYGPYQVKFKAWHGLPWSDSSEAVVGHGLTVDSSWDYGVHVEIASTKLDQFHCRWTNTGVTIIEPTYPGAQSGLEHFVPASAFLGGR